MKQSQKLAAIVMFLAAVLPTSAEKPEILKEPSSVFQTQDTGDFGLYGSELRSDFVYPLDCVARLHPLAKDKTIMRITRTGGWSRASFLIVPQNEPRAYLVYWHTAGYNQSLKVSEDTVRTKWVEGSEEFDTLISSSIMTDPQGIRKLRQGNAGDDSPFLLVEKLTGDRYEGAVVSPTLYNGEIKKLAETMLKSLERCFTEVITPTKPNKSE